MRFAIINLFLIGLLIGGIPVNAQDDITPAALLPHDTLFYLEMKQTSPYIEFFQNLTQSFGMEKAFPVAGDTMILAILPSENFASALLILPVERDTDLWLLDHTQNNGEWASQSGRDWGAWFRTDTLFSYGYLRIGDYLIIGEQRGLEALIQSFTTSSKLSDSELFQSTNTNETDLGWAYVAITQTVWRFFADETGIGVEMRQQRTPPSNPIPAAFDPQVLNAVPIGAWFVYTGMNADLPLQEILTTLRELVAFLGEFNDTLSNLPNQLDSLVRAAAGVDLEQDVIPLFAGGYALYVQRTPSDNLPLGLNVGIVLAPQSAEGAFFTLTRISNRLGQNLNMTPEISAPAQYTLPIPVEGFPPLVYGVADNQYIYATTPEGANLIHLALESGINLNTDVRWKQVLENAPAGVQHITYFNLGEITDTLNIGLAQNTDLELDLGDWQPFESLAIYYHMDANGVYLTRLWLYHDVN